MAEWLKVIILGIVEGVTEFLPISSTGHLIIAAEFLQLRESLSGTFEIFIQIGAVIAVIAFYSQDLWRQARTVHRDTQVQRLWLAVMVAFIPAAVLGLLLDDFITEVLFSPQVVALALIVGGVGFIVIERYYQPKQETPPVIPVAAVADSNTPPQIAATTEPTTSASVITLKQAFIIGLWQTLALIPGMSRSGMSIIGGLLSGLNRKAATEFSFYLAIPTLGGATLYTLVRNLDEISSSDLMLLFLGAVVSGIVAWFSIAWLLRYISRNTFIPFGYYRIIVGILILLLSGIGV